MKKENPSKETTEALKQYLQDIRSCLKESVPGFNDKDIYNLYFSRVGSDYHIEKMPVPPSDVIGEKLEQSFNNFMKGLNVNYTNIKIEGSCIIGVQTNTFLIGYQNYETKEIKRVHTIEGVIK